MSPRRLHRGRWVLGAALIALLAVAGAAAVVLSSAKATLTADSTAIAKLDLPFGSGTVQSVSVVTGPHSQPVPVSVHGGSVILPDGLVPAGEKLQVQVVIRRPGWISWLAGSTQRLSLNVKTPAASLRSHFVTLSGDGRLILHFRPPGITAYSYGSSRAHMTRHVLAAPTTSIVLPHSGPAGDLVLSGAPLSWEKGGPATVSWFPPGSAATAVASPAPGATLTSATPITLTFSRPYESVLHGHMPPVSPITQGTWHRLNSHTIRFEPEGYGYGLGAQVQIPLPSGVRLAGGRNTSDASAGTWTVPGGSTLRLQQLLAQLGYLPLNFTANGSATPLTFASQEAAALSPPSGKFSFRWSNIPSWYRATWAPGAFGELTKAAVMTFENNSGLPVDGVAGQQVWKDLITAAIQGRRNSFGYTIADVSEASPESLTLWHNGQTVLTTAVNTGIPQAPTALGTFAVYEHLPVTTMSGTNPNGTHYNDPGIPWVSYFNGGDALHGFLRAQYGFPQSLGCVEMPYATAGKVYPYTPIGTIVHVA
ncbi:MAG: L,D-transpeptidase family protein [Solirubrobacteraceae bacterium]